MEAAARRLEDEKSTKASIEQKLTEIRAKIDRYVERYIPTSEWARLTELVQRVVDRDIDRVLTREKEASASSDSSHGDWDFRLHTWEYAEEDASRVLSLIYKYLADQKITNEQTLPMRALACYLYAQKLIDLQKIPDANHTADDGLQLSDFAKEFLNLRDKYIEFGSSEAGKVGAAQKERYRDPAKDLVADLLKELTPDTGWKSPRAASVVVEDKLIHPKTRNFKNEYLKVFVRAGLNPSSFQRTLYNWFLKDAKLEAKDQQFNLRLARK